MTTYAKLKESLDQLGYVAMLEQCTLHQSHRGTLKVYHFDRPMLAFNPSGDVKIQIVPEVSYSECELNKLNAYLPEPYKMLHQGQYLCLSNTLSHEHYVYKPNLTIQADGQVTGDVSAEKMSLLLTCIQASAQLVLETALHNPPRKPIERRASPILPWELADNLFAQALTPGTMLFLLDEVQKNTDHRALWAALANAFAHEPYVRPMGKPPNPRKENNAGYITAAYGTCVYAANSRHLFCTVHPKGSDGTMNSEACVNCPDWQSKASQERALWLEIQRAKLRCYQMWQRRYSEIVATIQKDDGMQNRLRAEMEKTLKRGLTPIYVVF